MARVELPALRSTIMDSPGGCELTIPAKRNFFAVAFLGFWTIGWACGEVFAIRQLFFEVKGENFPAIFLMAWLGAWTVGGVVAIYTWLWMVVGKERIVLKPATLSIQRDVLGFGKIREYDLNHVANLRLSPQTYNPFDMSSSLRFWGIGGGLVAFDYGAKTFRFGGSIDEAEAQNIINELNKRHKF